MSNIPKDLPERIKYLREQKEISQSDLAKRIGLDASRLSRIENGEIQKVSDDVVLAIAQIFEQIRNNLSRGKGALPIVVYIQIEFFAKLHLQKSNRIHKILQNKSAKLNRHLHFFGQEFNNFFI